MRSKLALLLLVVGLCAQIAWADLRYDGVDDDLTNATPFNDYLSPSAGAMMLWYRPEGTAPSTDSSDCWGGAHLLSALDVNSIVIIGLFRNGDLGGVDRLCAWNYDGSADRVVAAYTVNTWTHLALVHSGGNLSFYKDGLLVGTVASGDTVPFDPPFLHLGAGATEGSVTGVEVFLTLLPSPAEIAAKANARLHRFGSTGRSGAWTLDSCATTGNAHAFYDHSGSGRSLTGDDGANNTGLTCQSNSVLVYPWGPD